MFKTTRGLDYGWNDNKKCWCKKCQGTLHQDYNIFAQFVFFFCLLSAFVGMLAVINYSLKKHEMAQCIKWASYAKNYPEFYYTNDQKKQCNIK